MVHVNVIHARKFQEEDAQDVRRIFAAGMRSLTPALTKTGTYGTRFWTILAAVVSITAYLTLTAGCTVVVGSCCLAAVCTGVAWRLVATRTMQRAMNSYIQESLEGDLKDIMAFYMANADGEPALCRGSKLHTPLLAHTVCRPRKLFLHAVSMHALQWTILSLRSCREAVGNKCSTYIARCCSLWFPLV